MSERREARREQRLATELSATVSVDGLALAVRTRDISRSGLCLISDARIAPETELTVKLVLTLGPTTTSEPLMLSGRAAWCTALFGKFQVGVKFVEVEGERRRFLDLFMRFLSGEIRPAGAPEVEPDGPQETPGDKDDPFRY